MPPKARPNRPAVTLLRVVALTLSLFSHLGQDLCTPDLARPEVRILRGGQLQLTGGFFCPRLHSTWPPGRRCLCCSKLSLCCLSQDTEWLFVPLADKASANSHLSRVHTHKHGHAALGGVANDIIPTLEPKLTNRLTYSWGADELISYANWALCLGGHTYQFHLLASDSIKEDSSVFNLSYSLGF